MKDKQNLKQSYLTHGNWHSVIRDFLNKTNGNYLEIGVFRGYFLAELGIDYPHKHLYGIDPYISDGHTGQPQGTILTDVEEICNHNISDLDNITLFKCTTEQFLENNNLSILDNITCVLVDGSHHYNDIKIDIELIKKINNKEQKLIIFDDLHVPDVRQCIEEFKTDFNNRIQTELAPNQFIIL